MIADGYLDNDIKIDDINEKYIKWLEEFTQKFYYFTDTKTFAGIDLAYVDYSLTPEDSKNVVKLGLLYNYIEKYARNNSISGDEINKSCIYSIRYNGVGYIIGKCLETPLFFCRRVVIQDCFIDFQAILLYYCKQKSDSTQNNLNMLSEIIENLIQNNVPAEVITETAQKTIKKILSNNK